MTDSVIKIPVSKTKLVFLIIVSVLFVLLCLWVFQHADKQEEHSPLLMKIVGVVGVAFFGLGIVIFPQKFFEKNTDLIIDQNGIQNKFITNKIVIEWHDIVSIHIKKVVNDMLLIEVSDPQKYLNQMPKNKQRGMRNNLYLCGTPFAIPSSIFACSLKDMAKLMNTKLDESRKAG